MGKGNSMIKRIKNYLRIRKAVRRFILLGRMIDAIDKGFAKNNISRQKRRQFWDDFVNSPEARKKILQEMKKGFYGIQKPQ